MSPDIIKNEYLSRFSSSLERTQRFSWIKRHANKFCTLLHHSRSRMKREWNDETAALSLCISIKARLHFFIATCIKRNECFIVYRYHCAVASEPLRKKRHEKRSISRNTSFCLKYCYPTSCAWVAINWVNSDVINLKPRKKRCKEHPVKFTNVRDRNLFSFLLISCIQYAVYEIRDNYDNKN